MTAVELPPLKVRPRPFQACVAPQFGEELHDGGLARSWSRLSSHGPFALSLCPVPDSLHLTGRGGREGDETFRICQGKLAQMNCDVLRQPPRPKLTHTPREDSSLSCCHSAMTMTAVGVGEGASVKRRKQDNLSVERRLS